MDQVTLTRAAVQQALHVATAAAYPVALIATLRAALEQKPKFTLSCGCPSQYGGAPAEWPKTDREGNPAVAYGVVCERHWHEYEARCPNCASLEAQNTELDRKLASLEQPKPPPEAQTEAERLAYCAGWWAAMEQKREQPAQEPVAWIEHGLVEAPDGLVWEKRSVGYYTPLYTHPPRRELLTVTDLQQALVAVDLVDPDAIDDPEGFDNGFTLQQIDALHSRLMQTTPPTTTPPEPK
jgi:hypothetical protein